MKHFFCYMMAILVSVMFLILVMTTTSNAANQLYTGESYFTYNVGGHLYQRQANTNEDFIQDIPRNSLLYVFGKITFVSKYSDSRSMVQYKGKDGHVLDTGFGEKLLPHTRNYYTSVVNADVKLKNDKGNVIYTIPKGSKIEVYGVYSLNKNESVIRYNYDYTKVGHIPNKYIGNNFNQTKLYSGNSYFTYNVGGGINQREANQNENLIQYIPKDSLLYVYGKCTFKSEFSDSRSMIQYKGKDGHVLDTGFGKKLLPHIRNYYTSEVNDNVKLKDDNGNIICNIPKGSKIEVYGVYTLNTNESVIRYNYDYTKIGHIPNKYIGNNVKNEKQDLSDFNLKSKNKFVALTTANWLSFQNTKGEEVREIPQNSMIIIYGVWAGNSSRYVAYWDGGYGTVNSQYITQLYDIPNGFNFTNDIFWGITSCDLDMWNVQGNNTYKEIPSGSLVLVLGQNNKNNKQYVVAYKDSCVAVTKQYVKPTTKSIVTKISIQKVLLLENGKISYSMNCVTGKPGTSTRVGSFKVKNKTMNTELTDGRTYWLDVKYWVPFDGGIGFHDNINRINFGGNIYMTNGSHGCVNLSLDNAKTLYDFTYVGMRVDVIN